MFETLLDLDNDLVDWLIHASPSNDEQRAQMREVFALRAELDDRVNQLVASRLKLAASALSDEAQRLESVAKEMKATAKTIDSVESVIAIAGTAVEIAAKVVDMVAT
jgi:hypothetical protein